MNKFKPIQDDPTEIEHLQDVLIVRIEEALFFANTGNKNRSSGIYIFHAKALSFPLYRSVKRPIKKTGDVW